MDSPDSFLTVGFSFVCLFARFAKDKEESRLLQTHNKGTIAHQETFQDLFSRGESKQGHLLWLLPGHGNRQGKDRHVILTKAGI